MPRRCPRRMMGSSSRQQTRDRGSTGPAAGSDRLPHKKRLRPDKGRSRLVCKRCVPIDKPNSVPWHGYRQSCATAVIIYLGRPLPTASSNLPALPLSGPPIRRLRGRPGATLFGLTPRGVCPAAAVTRRAGELLPHPFTHHLYPGHARAIGWSTLCCTCRPRRGGAPEIVGTRCPVVFGLSSCRGLRKRKPEHAIT